MAVEQKRGCGYRKIGGTYLVSAGEGISCDRLPIELCVCPVCGQVVKQARGWTWVDVAGLVGGDHRESFKEQKCTCFSFCPLCYNVKNIGKAGLVWIGNRFYKTPEEFMAEGRALGFSRRIKSIPRGFKVGHTWVLLAHPKAVSKMVPIAPEVAGELGLKEYEEVVYKPGIFTLWRPSRIERICKESERGSEMVADLEKRGITPIFVPDDDPDHQGSVYDKGDNDETAET